MVQGSEFRIHGFRIQSAGVEDPGVVGSGFRVQSSGFRMLGFLISTGTSSIAFLVFSARCPNPVCFAASRPPKTVE